MDTDETYLGDEFYVHLGNKDVIEAKGTATWNVPEEAGHNKTTDRHILGERPPVDGWVTFYDPDLLAAGDPYKHGTFPFRDHRKSGLWFARPDATEWSRNPIWKWQNPDAPLSELTLSPSIGLRGGDEGEITFHCYIRNGEVDWL